VRRRQYGWQHHVFMRGGQQLLLLFCRHKKARHVPGFLFGR
jgi:hypothetical protein